VKVGRGGGGRLTGPKQRDRTNRGSQTGNRKHVQGCHDDYIRGRRQGLLPERGQKSRRGEKKKVNVAVRRMDVHRAAPGKMGCHDDMNRNRMGTAPMSKRGDRVKKSV